MFFILCDVIFLVRLQENFVIDHFGSLRVLLYYTVRCVGCSGQVRHLDSRLFVVFQSNFQAMRTLLSIFALVILVHSARGECRDGNWWDILNNDNVWATCNANEYITGLWRSEAGGFGLHGDDGLNRIEWPNAAVHLKEMQMLTAWMLTGGTPSTGIHVFSPVNIFSFSYQRSDWTWQVDSWRRKNHAAFDHTYYYFFKFVES